MTHQYNLDNYLVKIYQGRVGVVEYLEIDDIWAWSDGIARPRQTVSMLTFIHLSNELCLR